MSLNKFTRNLSRHEFECKCGCGSDFVDFRLLDVLQQCVDHFQDMNAHMIVGIQINSGTRCRKHNKKEGGKAEKRNWFSGSIPMTGSMHLYGKAADFYLYDKITGIHLNNDIVADYLEQKYPNNFGIGRYIGRTHVDTREKKARWDRR